MSVQRYKHPLVFYSVLTLNMSCVLFSGTGASCIFPLLGHTTYGWQFLATEVDSLSVQSAQSNVDRNSLGKQIGIRYVPDRQMLFDGVVLPEEA